jgi:hypothetical protein
LPSLRKRSEARVETKYDAVAGWRRSLQRQLSNGVIPSREYSQYLLTSAQVLIQVGTVSRCVQFVSKARSKGCLTDIDGLMPRGSFVSVFARLLDEPPTPGRILHDANLDKVEPCRSEAVSPSAKPSRLPFAAGFHCQSPTVRRDLVPIFSSTRPRATRSRHKLPQPTILRMPKTNDTRVLCAAKDETSVEFMRPLLNSWAECSVVISC